MINKKEIEKILRENLEPEIVNLPTKCTGKLLFNPRVKTMVISGDKFGFPGRGPLSWEIEYKQDFEDNLKEVIDRLYKLLIKEK